MYIDDEILTFVKNGVEQIKNVSVAIIGCLDATIDVNAMGANNKQNNGITNYELVNQERKLLTMTHYKKHKLTKRTDGRWQIKITKNKKSYYAYGKTQRECCNNFDALLKQLNTKQKSKKIKLFDWIEYYLNNYAIKLKSYRNVLNITNFVDSLMFNYDGASFDENDNAVCPWYDVDSTDFINYKNSYSAWETEYNTAKTNYENSLSDSASVLTADEELKIEFYDNLFNAIVDKGWSFNENINDPNYLNNMLQNNMFTITTVDRRDVSMDFSEDYYEKSIYSTDIATNMTNIVQVRDQEAMLEENSRYEEKKRIINKKETAIDLKIKEEEMKIQSWNVIKESLAKTIESNKDRLNVFG